MKHCLVGPVIVLMLAFVSTTADAQPKTTTRWSKVGNTPGFVGWRAQLQHMADAYGKAPVAHMCVVAATYTQVPNHDTNVWGYLYALSEQGSHGRSRHLQGTVEPEDRCRPT